MPSQGTRKPRTLALEASSTSGSVALLEGSEPRAELLLPSRPRVAQTLIPAIHRALRQVGWTPREVQLIAVTRGPGSFTGLRIGVTAAKTLAYALRADLVAVDTLEVLAWQAYFGLPTPLGTKFVPDSQVSDSQVSDSQASDSQASGEPASPDRATTRADRTARVHAVLDAQRGELYQAAFECGGESSLKRLTTTRIVDPESWLATLAPTDCLTGSGLSDLPSDRLAGRRIVGESLWMPRASVVGLLAGLADQAGHHDDLWTLTPDYFRQSAAEEKAARPGARGPS